MVFKVFPIVFNRFSNGFQRFSNNCRIWLNVTLETSVSEIFVGVRAHLAHNALTLLKRSYRKDCTVLTGIIFSNLGPAAMGACGIGSFCFSNLQKIICQQLGTARSPRCDQVRSRSPSSSHTRSKRPLRGRTAKSSWLSIPPQSLPL